MVPLKLDPSEFSLPPLRLDDRPVASLSGVPWLFAMRGLFVVVALSLPALGIHLSDRSIRTAGAGAIHTDPFVR